MIVVPSYTTAYGVRLLQHLDPLRKCTLTRTMEVSCTTRRARRWSRSPIPKSRECTPYSVCRSGFDVQLPLSPAGGGGWTPSPLPLHLSTRHPTLPALPLRTPTQCPSMSRCVRNNEFAYAPLSPVCCLDGGSLLLLFAIAQTLPSVISGYSSTAEREVKMEVTLGPHFTLTRLAGSL